MWFGNANRSRKKIASDDELARSEAGVDQSWYLVRYRDVAEAGADPVTHYLQHGWREGRDPRPDFSTTGYLTLNEEAAQTQQNPLIHYLRNGRQSGPFNSGTAAWHLLWKSGLLYPKLGHEPPHDAFPYGTAGRRKILFTGHEATRTGAPLILLSLMEALESATGAEIFLILERDGPLLERYRRVAHVVVNRHRALCIPEAMRKILESVARPGFDLAICNSADSWRLAQELRLAGLPHIVILVHERLSFYGDEIRHALCRHADRIVFPAEAVKAAAIDAHPEFRNALVLPQGLLDPSFGCGDRQAARMSVRKELGLTADTRIVLCCGTRIPRKGLDLFLLLAARLRSLGTAPLHFVWLGGDDQATEFAKYVHHDLAMLGLGSTMSLVTETTEPERYFLAADVFALTSREDPFPCVVHEAMACALPVVVFDGAGGACEAVADGCGIVVPYLDIDSMAQAVKSILENPPAFAPMAERAERRVQTVYRYSDYAQRVLDLCNELRSAPSPQQSHKTGHMAGGRDLPVHSTNSRSDSSVQYDAKRNVWTVSGFEDVIAMMRDPETFEVRLATLPSADIDVHTKVRRIMARAFSTTQVKDISQLTRKRAHELVEDIASRGSCELIGDYALPIALTAVAATLGIDPARMHDLRRWSSGFLQTENPLLSQGERDHHRSQVMECHTFMTGHIAELSNRARDPYIAPYLTGIEDKDGLTVSEQVNVAMFLIIAGTEATSALIGNAMLLLLDRPEIQARMRAAPDLISPFVEEVLRYDSPVQRTRRYTACPARLGGTDIPAGAVLEPLIAIANRDPAKFADADRFQIDRSPNEHLSFGFGRHLCLGAQLARLEVAIALETLLKRFPKLSWARPEEPVDFGVPFFVRGPVRLDLLCETESS